MSQLNKLREDLLVLYKNKEYDHIKSFFSYWKSEDEKIDKIVLFGHFFLSHYFKDTTPKFHREIIHMIMSLDNEYFACPRGFAKTTMVQTCCLFETVNKLQKYIVIIEKTFTEASEVIDAIRSEFADNDLLKLVYGSLLPKGTRKAGEVKEPDSEGDIVINGVRFRAKGFETTIRGLKYRDTRPTKIICDDVEKDEHINSAEQRKKYEDNFNQGIVPALDINGSIKCVGTILHYDSLLLNLITSHNGKIYRAYEPNDPENTLLWPSRWTYEALEKKRVDMQLDGKGGSAFAKEYLNDPIAEDERTFKYNWLFKREKDGRVMPARYITWDQFKKMQTVETMNGFATIDMADSTKESADFTGVVVEFIIPNGTRLRVDVRREKRNINGVIDLIFDIWEMWRPYGLLSIGVEKKGFEDQIMPLLEIEKKRRGIYPSICELKPMGRNKENRIKGALQGFYEAGKIVSIVDEDDNGLLVPIGDTMILLQELYDFPSSKHDDISDAEAYISDIQIVPLRDIESAPIESPPQDDPYNEPNMDSDWFDDSEEEDNIDDDPY